MPLFELYNITTRTVVERNREHALEQVSTMNDQLRRDRSPLRYILQQHDPKPTCTCGAEFRFECICQSSTDPNNKI